MALFSCLLACTACFMLYRKWCEVQRLHCVRKLFGAPKKQKGHCSVSVVMIPSILNDFFKQLQALYRLCRFTVSVVFDRFYNCVLPTGNHARIVKKLLNRCLFPPRIQLLSKKDPSRDFSPNLKQDLSGLSGFLDNYAQNLASK